MDLSRIARRNEQRKKRRQLIRRLMLGFITVSLIAVAVLFLWPQPPYIAEVSGRPNLVIDKPLQDFGTQHWDIPVTATFLVRNTGNHPLEILNSPTVRVVVGCCPPQVELSRRTIQPGQEATLSMTFVMHEGMDGQHDFRILLETNDPFNPSQELTVLSNWIQ
jgi:hypothetical protein